MKKVLLIDANGSAEYLKSLKDLLKTPNREIFIACKESEIEQWLRNNKIDFVIFEPVYPGANLINDKEVNYDFLAGAGYVLYKKIISITKAKIILYTTQSHDSLVKTGFPINIMHLRKPVPTSNLINLLECE